MWSSPWVVRCYYGDIKSTEMSFDDGGDIRSNVFGVSLPTVNPSNSNIMQAHNIIYRRVGWHGLWRTTYQYLKNFYYAKDVACAMMVDLSSRGIEPTTPEWKPNTFVNSATDQSWISIVFTIYLVSLSSSPKLVPFPFPIQLIQIVSCYALQLRYANWDQLVTLGMYDSQFWEKLTLST